MDYAKTPPQPETYRRRIGTPDCPPASVEFIRPLSDFEEHEDV